MKLLARVSLTTCNPIWMAISSDDAQYLPSRNSRTNTGTLAPTLTFRTRSFRTTLPAKVRLTLSSSASRNGTLLIYSNSQTNRNVFRRQIQDRIGLGVEDLDTHGLDLVVGQHEGHSCLDAWTEGQASVFKRSACGDGGPRHRLVIGKHQ